MLKALSSGGGTKKTDWDDVSLGILCEFGRLEHLVKMRTEAAVFYRTGNDQPVLSWLFYSKTFGPHVGWTLTSGCQEVSVSLFILLKVPVYKDAYTATYAKALGAAGPTIQRQSKLLLSRQYPAVICRVNGR